MKQYISPNIQIINIDATEVICTSEVRMGGNVNNASLQDFDNSNGEFLGGSASYRTTLWN